MNQTLNISKAFSDGGGFSNFALFLTVVIMLLLIVTFLSSALIALGNEIGKGNQDKGLLMKNIFTIIFGLGLVIAFFSIITI